MSEPPNVHTASAEFQAGPIRWSASAKITSGGLVATGVLVALVVLSVAPVVWAATSPARKRAENGQDARRIAQKRSAE